MTTSPHLCRLIGSIVRRNAAWKSRKIVAPRPVVHMKGAAGSSRAQPRHEDCPTLPIVRLERAAESPMTAACFIAAPWWENEKLPPKPRKHFSLLFHQCGRIRDTSQKTRVN